MKYSEIPVVTLGILCYNHENYLEGCFKSILSQEYRNIEIIINDDSSKDESITIIKKFIPFLEQKFNSVLLVKNSENQGICKSVNNIVRRAKGNYIKLLASDDLMHSLCISSLVEYMETHAEKIVCFTNGYIVDESYYYGDRVNAHQIFNKASFTLEGKDLFKKLMKGNFINTVGMMIRREAYEKYGFYDEQMSFEDYDMWLRLARFEEFGYLATPLVYYRRGETSITNVHSKNGKKKFLFMTIGTIKIFEKHIAYIEKRERIKYRKEFYNKTLRDMIEKNYFDFFLKWFKIMRKKEILLEEETISLMKRKNVIWNLVILYFKIKNYI